MKKEKRRIARCLSQIGMKKVKKLLQELRYIFTRQQKFKLFLLLLFTVFTTFMELLGVTAIMPFITVLMDPSTIERTSYLKWTYELLGFTNANYFLAFLAVVLIVIYIMKNVTVMIMYRTQYRFTFQCQRDLAYRMMRCYMYQPYYFHLAHNSADLIRSINGDIPMMFQGVLAMMQLIAEGMVCVILGTYLIIQDKSIAIGVCTFLIVFMFLFGKRFKKYLGRIGAEDRAYSASIVKWLQQSFGGMKETKILGREDYFLDHFDEAYSEWAEREKVYRFLQVFPRPVMEAFCISAMMFIIALKLLNGTSSAYFVATLSVFAIAAFRLLPSFNRITNYMSVIMFNIPAFTAVYNTLSDIEAIIDRRKKEVKTDEVMKLTKEIRVRNLSFKYPTGADYVLKDVNVTFPKNKSIALIGPSGAGKTTLADLLLGALEPTDGSILIDETEMNKNIPAWQRNVGYIPQNIYLMDDTIRNNIIYGADDVSEEKLWNAIEEAQLGEFVRSLPDGVETYTGELGTRLSGGQRQRIGIARALYNNPEVLVLDEATSALDNDTEKAVMDAIDSLAGSKTLIIIAHRLSTIENCDIVYEVKEEKVTLNKDSV